MLNAIAGLLLAIRLAYSSPVDYDIALAGNFGEPRPNHFHCGIDIKTGGVEGKRLLAISDGYVSRVTVGLSGFGNALYITHPDGNTSVYCHLKSFSPSITRLLRRWQYAHESYVADVRLGPLDCPVARGQFIAISGNTGASQAPHLHLELHETQSGHLKDPLDVLGSCINDGQAPMAHAFMAYPVPGKGVFEGGSGKRSYAFTGYKLNRKFRAWGKVGFGIWANDYMEVTYNKYGVRETVLRVDGNEVFRSCMDGIPPTVNRRINYWGDYQHYFRYGTWYLKSFRTPGNTLPFITADGNGGIVDFNEERNYHIEYSLADYFGNTSVYEFVVCGNKEDIQGVKQGKQRETMHGDRLSTYSYPGVYVVIPKGMLDDDITLSPRKMVGNDAFSPLYSFYDRPCPLASWAELGIAVRSNVADTGKLYVKSNDGKYCGGRYRDGWVVANIRELGIAYCLAYDSLAPRIVPFGRNSWVSRQRVRVLVTDGESGLMTFKGFLDGEFVLFERIDKTDIYECKLPETPVRRLGKQRMLTLVAIDKRKNKSVQCLQIEY